MVEKKKENCMKCGTRAATKDDHLCDPCRFTQMLENMISDRKESEKPR